jgi:hypothetical protein
MNIEKFFYCCDEQIISPNEAQLLNEALAKISPQDIPIEKRMLVVGYLEKALNMKSVEHTLVPKLDLLLSELQKKY